MLNAILLAVVGSLRVLIEGNVTNLARERHNWHMKQICMTLACLLAAVSAVGDDALSRGFAEPPAEARPRCWWHWMSNFISKEGITRDLEAMKRAGLGGATILDICEMKAHGQVKSLSDEWYALVQHAGHEADRLGLALSFHNCPGWSSSGGPWIKPEQAMKMLGWNETVVDGGRRVSVRLPAPVAPLGWFRDVAVLALPARPGDRFDEAAYRPVKTVADRRNADFVVTGDMFDYTFAAPVEIGSVILAFGPKFSEYNLNHSAIWEISVSDDGRAFRPHYTSDFVLKRDTRVVSFPPVRTRWLRLCARQVSRTGKGKADLLSVSFSPAVRIPQYPRKAMHEFYRNAFTTIPDVPFDDVLACPPDRVVAPSEIVDLTDRMLPDGTLDWDAPSGTWVVQRFYGYARKSENHPVNPEARGLECDKLSRTGVDAALDGMMTRIMDEAKAGGVKAFGGTLVDSFEVGPQNWTDRMPEEFRRLAGYDLRKWLPVATGRYIGSAELSERFLEDFRSVLAELYAEVYADYFAEVCHRKGLEVEYETYCGPFDYVRLGRSVDVPMGELWHGPPTRIDASPIPANVADVFGKKYVQTETFTAGDRQAAWTSYPGDHKRQGDAVYCTGVNRFVFHSYAHQPFDTPGAGITMGKWGFHFNRCNTLWEFYPGWLDYLGRAQYLLQQGRGVADIVYAMREDQPSHLDFDPTPPAGCRANGVDVRTFLRDIRFDRGELALPSGMRYRLIVVGDTTRTSVPFLAKVAALAEAGADVLLGPRPHHPFGLKGFETGDAEYHRLVARLWDGFAPAEKAKRLGRGRLWRETDPGAILAELKLPRDFVAEGADEINFIHRRLSDRDVYFVANAAAEKGSRRFTGVFRATGTPEFWNALDGSILPVRDVEVRGGLTRIPLELPHAGSVFVVFRRDGASSLRGTSASTFQPQVHAQTLVDLSHDWQVRFQPERGAPEGEIAFPELRLFNTFEDFGIRHFSGTATYSKTFAFSPDGRRVFLEVKDVHDVARVFMNGRDCGYLWTPPYRVEVTAALVADENRLEIQVANRWMNRVIGDEHLPVDGEWDSPWGGGPTLLMKGMPDWFVQGRRPPSGRIAFSTARPWTKASPLAPAGLEGPVELKTTSRE